MNISYKKLLNGTLSDNCLTCNTADSEEHRLNVCTKYLETNFLFENEKIPFDTVFSTNVELLRNIIERIGKVWNVKTGHGSMNT